MTGFPMPTTWDPDALFLIQGILAILVLGSLAALVLKLVVADRKPHAVIDNVVARVGSWWIIAALVGLAFWAGKAGVYLLFASASLVALREFIPSPEDRPGEWTMLVTAFFGVLPMQYWLIWRGHDALAAGLIPAYCFFLLPIIAVLAGDPRDLPRRVSLLQWGLMLCVLGVSYAPALLTVDVSGYEGRDGFLLMFLLLVSQLGDVFQYLWGKAAGRHALAPAISPSKTVEGTVGGVLSATALGAGLAWTTPFSAPQAALMALGISLLGVLGGLTLSAIKRDRGIKDWSRLIAGHGGMLDRLDSLCFSAPAFYYAVKALWAQ